MWQTINAGDYGSITLEEDGDWAVRLSGGRSLLLWKDGSVTREQCVGGIVTKEPGEGREIVVERFLTTSRFKYERGEWLSHSERRPLAEVLRCHFGMAARTARVVLEVAVLAMAFYGLKQLFGW
jgi:hypothetical protein